MSIAQRLTTIAENQQKIYDKAKEDFGVVFNERANDYLTIENVNPKEHDVKVQLSSKNILLEHKYPPTHTDRGITCDYEGNGIFHIYGEVTPVSSTSYSFIDYTQIAIPIKSNSYYTLYAKVIEGSTTHTINPFINSSEKETGSGTNWISVSVTKNTSVGTISHTTKKGDADIPNPQYAIRFRFYIYLASGANFRADIRIQVWLVEGKYDETSQYTPHFDDFSGIEIKTSENDSDVFTSYLSDAEGKATVKSVSPTMHITTDADGVQINAKGYLDGKRVIDELTQAIVDVGGDI